MITRYIYLRSLPCQIKTGIYSRAGLPVGCIAYQDIGDGTLAYGLSFFNTEVEPSLSKKEARRVADARLLLALQGDDRRGQQGRWGFIRPNGNSLNERVSDMIHHIINEKKIHGADDVRERIVMQLSSIAKRLVTPRIEDEKKSA